MTATLNVVVSINSTTVMQTYWTALHYKIIFSLDIQPPLRTPELKGDQCICLKQNGLKQNAQSPTLEKDVSDDILKQAIANQGYKVTDIQ